MNDKVIIYKPKNDHSNVMWRHAGDTFREIIDMWESAGYVTVITTDDTPGIVWWNKKGDVMLYDRPTFEWLPNGLKYNLGLFGNPVPPQPNDLNRSWIFWGRNPKLLESTTSTPGGLPNFQDRETKSIFIGNVENHVQQHFRSPIASSDEWKSCISHFELIESHKHKYSASEYLQMLLNSQFGLSIRGYGPKCNREIELLACGTVPLLTMDVDVSYYDPLIEGLHYFRVRTPNDVNTITSNCPKARWELMSTAGRRWYERNCTTSGSFKTTKRIIERECTPTQTTNFVCVATMATKQCWNDLQLMLFSLYQFHPDIRVYIVCDSYIQSVVPDFVMNECPNLSYALVNTLDQYTDLDRKVMEQTGKFLEFTLRKNDAIDAAFQANYNNVLFVDSDMVFLNEIDFREFDVTKDLGRSPHHNRMDNQKLYGIYNAGFLWINHQGFSDWWRYSSITPISRYYEQAILENADEYFSTFDIPIQYNYGWWRLYECEPVEIAPRESKFRVIDGYAMYDGKPLRTIHTHFGEKNFGYTVKFNQFMLRLLVACKDSRQKRVYDFINELFYGKKRIKESTQLNITMNEDNSNNIKPVEEVTDVTNTKTVDTADAINAFKELPASVALERSKTQPLEYADIHLIAQYYNDSNPDRQDEIDYCFQANLENPHIVKVHNLREPNTTVPEWLKNHPKYVEHVVDGWLKYKQVFDYAEENLPPNSTVCLCNADIFLDHNSRWKDAKMMLEYSLVFCQSRYEFDGEGGAKKDEALQKIAYANAQDAWLFKTPFPVRDCDFKMGKLGSDNAIADRIKNSGYIPINSPNQFKIYHYDVCRGKTGKNFLQLQKPNPEKPEDRGYYLLPDIDAINSVDSLINAMGLGTVHKYRVICDVMSRYIEIKNPGEKNDKK